VIWFIVRRFLGLILTLWIVFTLSFLLMHAVPGGPYSSDRNLPKEIEANFK
jgi:oligopeptide transport system permease protein